MVIHGKLEADRVGHAPRVHVQTTTCDAIHTFRDVIHQLGGVSYARF
jgi:hypothetical protein